MNKEAIQFDLPEIPMPGGNVEACEKVSAAIRELIKHYPQLGIEYGWKMEGKTPARFWVFSTSPIGYYAVGHAVGAEIFYPVLHANE